jgi:hypothetical protein
MAAAACTLLITNAAQAAVIVTFEQVGPDVVATWSGTLNPGRFEFDFNLSALRFGSFNGLGYIVAGEHDQWGTGSASATTLALGPTASTFSGAFSSNSFYWPGLDNSSSDTASLDFGSGTSYQMTWSGMALTDIGASSFHNTRAWTSSAGDTITFTTVSAVPEPSAALLCALGCLGALRRRR